MVSALLRWKRRMKRDEGTDAEVKESEKRDCEKDWERERPQSKRAWEVGGGARGIEHGLYKKSEAFGVF